MAKIDSSDAPGRTWATASITQAARIVAITLGALREPRAEAPPGLRVWSRLFPGERDQVEAVRAFVGAVLDGHTCRPLAQLIASELGANAVQHTRSGQPEGWFVVHVLLSPCRARARVRVFDLGHPHNAPTLTDLTPEAESGRGLPLVCALAQQWGVEGDAAGRVVWAELADERE
jgi:serine/threonine-protein kinase RsbW